MNHKTVFSIYSEYTPNPNVMKFVSNQLLTTSILEFEKTPNATDFPLIHELFLLPFVKTIFLGSNFISIQKNNTIDWDSISSEIRILIQEKLNSGIQISTKKVDFKKTKKTKKEIIIEEILEKQENSNINIEKLLEFHKGHGKLATVTAVRPPARFGGLEIEDDKVTSFVEKSPASAGWINGGFFVFEPEVLSYIDGPSTKLEAEPLSKLAQLGELMAYRHQGFWKPMDTLREMRELETMWSDGNAPWIISEETNKF